MGRNNFEEERELHDHSELLDPDIRDMRNFVEAPPEGLIAIPDVDTDTDTSDYSMEDYDLDDLDYLDLDDLEQIFGEETGTPEPGQIDHILGGSQLLEISPPGPADEPVAGSSLLPAQGQSLGSSPAVGNDQPPTNAYPQTYEEMEEALEEARQRLMEAQTRLASLQAKLRQ